MIGRSGMVRLGLSRTVSGTSAAAWIEAITDADLSDIAESARRGMPQRPTDYLVEMCTALLAEESEKNPPTERSQDAIEPRLSVTPPPDTDDAESTRTNSKSIRLDDQELDVGVATAVGNSDLAVLLRKIHELTQSPSAVVLDGIRFTLHTYKGLRVVYLPWLTDGKVRYIVERARSLGVLVTLRCREGGCSIGSTTPGSAVDWTSTTPRYRIGLPAWSRTLRRPAHMSCKSNPQPTPSGGLSRHG